MKILYDNSACNFIFCEGEEKIPIIEKKVEAVQRQELFNIDRYRIEVSLTCDLQCSYCIVHMNNVHQQNSKMNEKTANAIIERFNEEVGANGSIFIIGGEPLTNLKVTKLIIEKSNGQSIVFTNSKALTDDTIEFFYKHNTYILTSLDGSTLEHNKKRFYPKIKENYSSVVNNIKKAIKRGCKVGVSCLLHEDNVEDGESIAVFFADELGAKAMSFAYPHLTMSDSEENHFDFEKYTASMIKIFNVAKEKGIYVDQIGKIISSFVYGPSVIGCKAGTSQRTFYPNGDETVCTKIDTVTGFNMIDYINQLPFFARKCNDCIGKGVCTGECPWDYLVECNNTSFDMRICNYRRTFIQFIINDIIKELSVANSVEEARERFDMIYGPLMNNYNE